MRKTRKNNRKQQNKLHDIKSFRENAIGKKQQEFSYWNISDWLFPNFGGGKVKLLSRWMLMIHILYLVHRTTSELCNCVTIIPYWYHKQEILQESTGSKSIYLSAGGAVCAALNLVLVGSFFIVCVTVHRLFGVQYDADSLISLPMLLDCFYHCVLMKSAVLDNWGSVLHFSSVFSSKICLSFTSALLAAPVVGVKCWWCPCRPLCPVVLAQWIALAEQAVKLKYCFMQYFIFSGSLTVPGSVLLLLLQFFFYSYVAMRILGINQH